MKRSVDFLLVYLLCFVGVISPVHATEELKHEQLHQMKPIVCSPVVRWKMSFEGGPNNPFVIVKLRRPLAKNRQIESEKIMLQVTKGCLEGTVVSDFDPMNAKGTKLGMCFENDEVMAFVAANRSMRSLGWPKRMTTFCK